MDEEATAIARKMIRLAKTMPMHMFNKVETTDVVGNFAQQMKAHAEDLEAALPVELPEYIDYNGARYVLKTPAFTQAEHTAYALNIIEEALNTGEIIYEPFANKLVINKASRSPERHDDTAV